MAASPASRARRRASTRLSGRGLGHAHRALDILAQQVVHVALNERLWRVGQPWRSQNQGQQSERRGCDWLHTPTFIRAPPMRGLERRAQPVTGASVAAKRRPQGRAGDAEVKAGSGGRQIDRRVAARLFVALQFEADFLAFAELAEA